VGNFGNQLVDTQLGQGGPRTHRENKQPQAKATLAFRRIAARLNNVYRGRADSSAPVDVWHESCWPLLAAGCEEHGESKEHRGVTVVMINWRLHHGDISIGDKTGTFSMSFDTLSLRSPGTV